MFAFNMRKKKIFFSFSTCPYMAPQQDYHLYVQWRVRQSNQIIRLRVLDVKK